MPGGTDQVGSVPKVEQPSDDAPATHGHREDPAHAEGGAGRPPRPDLYDTLDSRKISISAATDTAERKTE